jgi:hypothetical protein
MKKILLLLTGVLFSGSIFGLDGDGTSGNPYSGNLMESTTFGPGTIYISGRIETQAHTLTIQPGTTLRIFEGVDIYIQAGGNLFAVGNGTDPIIFTADDSNWGHVYFYNSQGSVLDYCIFEKGRIPLTNNSGHGGAIYIEEQSSVQISNSIFRKNEAYHGGAIEVKRSAVEISDCIFEANTAYRGSAIFLTGNAYTPVIKRCKIYSNHATDRSAVHGLTDAAGTIQNCLIYNNTSDTGGGGVNFGGDTEGTILLSIINCVIANNTNIDVYFRGSARFSVTNSIIWGSSKSVYFDSDQSPRVFNLINCATQGAYRGTTEIDIESTFQNSFTLNSINSASDGPNFIYPLTNYNITYISPCCDRGTSSGSPAPPVTDFIYNGRIGLYDIGAYEVQGSYSRWTGDVSREWNNPGNWLPYGVPGSMNDVGIFDAIYDPEITGPDPVSCNNLIIEPLANLTVKEGGLLTVDELLVINSSSTNHSGSLINHGSVTGSVSYNRHMNATNYHYFSSPVVSSTFPTLNTVWAYNEVSGNWDITTTCKSGVGYTIETGNDLLNFTGSLVSEEPIEIDVTSPYNDIIGISDDYNDRLWVDESGHSGTARSLDKYGAGGWNLLGNPYTSAMQAANFVSTNSTQFDPNYVAIYLWDGSAYYYIGNSTGWGTGRPGDEKHIQVGQGFFVLAMNDYSSFTFSKSMQDYDTEVSLLKSAKIEDRWPGLQLKVKNGNNENVTTVVFNEEMTVGLDPGYDVGLMASGSDVEIYTALLQDNGVNFARQALPIIEFDKNVIPVGVDTEIGGKVTFSAEIEQVRNFKFILEDRGTGFYTDLQFNHYTVTLPAKTYGTGRFFIHISESRGKGPRTKQSNLLNVRMWASQNHRVNIEGSISDKATCQVYNIRGQIIFETNLTDSGYNTFYMPQDVKGVHLVKVMDAGKVSTKKVVFL